MTENLKITKQGEEIVFSSPKIDKNKSGELTGYASIDRPWMKYYSREYDENEIPDMSIFQLICEANKNHLDDVAIDVRSSVNGFKHGIKITYNQYIEKMKSFAKSAKVIGIETDEIVPILLPNIFEARIGIYGNSIVGATSYPISPLLPPNQFDKILSENNINTIFIFYDFLLKYGDVIKNSNVKNVIVLDGKELFNDTDNELFENASVILGENKNVYTWNSFMELGVSEKEVVPYYNPNHIAAIIGTSGTTGTSKGVCLTDKNVNASALAYLNGDCFPGKTFMDALMPSIGYGISMVNYETVSGKHVYLIPELLTDKFPSALRELTPDVFAGGPVHYINENAMYDGVFDGLPQKRNYVSGGASLAKALEMKLNNVDDSYEEDGINHDIFVRPGYALSETTATASYSKWGAYRFGSIGIPVPYSLVSIFEPGTDNELQYNEQGEICICGPTVMAEYLNNPEETESVIRLHKDGRYWVHSKDIGYMDENGHLFHVDRIKNIFMRTGFNVHPQKIAEFINTLPFVRNCAVIGFDHPIEQCVPVAFIELTDGFSYDESDLVMAIASECENNLEATSVPVRYEFVDSLPINVGGKIDLQRLKKESEIDFSNDKHAKILDL